MFNVKKNPDYRILVAFFVVIAVLIVGFYANGAHAQDQVSWSMDPGAIRDAVNAKGYNFPGSSAFYYDNATAQKVCQILGYNRVVSMDTKYPEKHSHTGYRDGWYSPGDNQLSRWTGSNFRTANAREMGNIWISSLTCADKIVVSSCSDNADNDGDGKKDSQDSDCHTDGNPNNAGSYDANRNELGGGNTCADSIDNNGNGLIDGADAACHTDGNANNPSSYDRNRSENPIKVDVINDQKVTVIVADDDNDSKNNIEIFVTDGRETVKRGEVITYKVIVKNNRSEDATNVKIINRLASHLSPFEVKPSATADAKSRNIVWDHQTISAKSEVTFAVKVRVLDSAPNGYLIQNVAIANGDGIRANAVDNTMVEGGGQVAGVATAVVSQPVPVTAKTGVSPNILSMMVSFAGTVATIGTLITKKLF